MVIKTIVRKNKDNYYVKEVDKKGKKIHWHDAKSNIPYPQLLKRMGDKNMARAVSTSLSIRNKPYENIELYCTKK